MASKVPFLFDPKTGPLDHSPWAFSAVKKTKYTSNAYVNESATSRRNPVFQIPRKMRVKHDPSPGEDMTLETHPRSQANLECAISRSDTEMHEWFAGLDKKGARFTFENQSVAWPGKRPKALEDIVPEGLYSTCIKDGVNKEGVAWVDLGWDPSLRLKLIPPEGETTDGKIYKNRRPTRVYVFGTDEEGKETYREGVLADIAQGDEIVPIVYIEKWYATKDTARFALCVDECAVYKSNSRPAAPQLRAIDGSDAPMVKRARRDPEDEPAGVEAAAATATNDQESDSGQLFGVTDDDVVHEETGF